MENITFQQLVGLCAVVLILMGGYNTIMSAVKTHREEKRRKDAPVDELAEKVLAHDEMLAKDKRRLDAMDEQIDRMDEQSTIMLRGVRALLSHEINGNSNDKLKASATEIDDYLIARK